MIYTLDIESYPNLFTVQLTSFPSTSKLLFSTHKENHRAELHTILTNPANLIVTFNGNSYDYLMIDAYFHTPHLTPEQLNQVSNIIIQDSVTPYKFTQATGIHRGYYPNHIDLIEVAPGQGSLKAYAARLHAPHLQDLPYPPETQLTPEQKLSVVQYCFNDLEATSLLLNSLLPQLQLRTTMSKLYGSDLRSKSDAQIAETVIVSELSKLLGEKPRRPSKSVRPPHVIYDPPPYLQFQSPALQDALNAITSTPFPIAASGKLEMPKPIKDLKLQINTTSYNLGMGGLHSMEKEQAVIPQDNQVLADFDVTSYYPSIILNCELYPEHLTSAFMDIYRSLVERRVKAKHRVKEIKDEISKLEKELENAIA